MKSFYLKEFDEETFLSITKWLDELWEEEWQIYINSWWGALWVQNIILERIEKLNIKLIWLFMWSCAFDLFYRFTKEKELSYWCDWVVHTDAVSSSVFQYKGKLKVRWDDIDKRRVTRKADFAYNFLTKKEQKQFYNWEDIYIDYERMKLIFKSK